MLRCKESDFNLFLHNAKKSYPFFMVKRKRNSKSMIVKNRTAVFCGNKHSLKVPKPTERKILALFGNVKKNFNKYILANNLIIPSVQPKFSSVFRNGDLYKQLPEGAEFYIIDANHCYWRIAFMLGYINKNLYKKTLAEGEKLKLFRNMALACTIAPNRMEYWLNGNLVNEITEDTTLYQTMYKNIRYTAYNAMGTIYKAVGEQYCIAYKTDGVYVLPDKADEVKRLFKKHKLLYKTIKCHKVSDKEYRVQDELKRL